MAWVRSAVFFIIMVVVTMFCATACLLGLLASYEFRYRVTYFWCWCCLGLLRLICGLSGRILGAENLPKTAAVVMCKHQSAWETIALQKLLPYQSWVVKRELLWIPFFGWGLWSLRPIALNRSKRVEASRQLLEKGAARIREGAWVLMFPEGTRVQPGEKGVYKPVGARLACSVEVPVVPIAVNSGEFWPRNAFCKEPGEITLSIGPPIATVGKTPQQVTREVETWIEAEMEKISGVGPYWPKARMPLGSTGHAG